MPKIKLKEQGPSRYLSVPQFMAALPWQPSYSTIWRWIADGKLAAVNVSIGKRPVYKIPRSELERVLALYKERGIE